jgi:hypothetical protein
MTQQLVFSIGNRQYRIPARFADDEIGAAGFSVKFTEMLESLGLRQVRDLASLDFDLLGSQFQRDLRMLIAACEYVENFDN